jgi:DNA-binding XRE family transcriptional regulator
VRTLQEQPFVQRGRTARALSHVFCQNAFCRRLYNISPTIVWVPSRAAEFQKRLGARVREIRTAKGFSQESFAEACDLHRTHVSLLERGRINITVNTARQIARVLEINLSELFRGLG